MFKAYDIRTVANDLTVELAERLAHVEAYYFRNVLKTNTVILCRDARSTGEKYLDIGKKIFREHGFEVLIVPGVQSTCYFYFCCMNHPHAAGIMYGASHNPGGDTGQKIVGPGVMPIAFGCGPEKGLAMIRELYVEKKMVTPSAGQIGQVKEIDHFDDYIAYSMRLAGVKDGELKGLRIFMDFLHGAAGKEFLQAFTLAGASIESLHTTPDGTFPAGPPNPVIPETIAPGLQILREKDFHLGLFFDGDGDRIDFYSTDGELLSPSFNMSLIAEKILQLSASNREESIENQFVYACLKASPVALQRISANGVNCKIIRNGHSQIKQALADNVETGCLAAVEESAHYYLNFPFNEHVYSSENTLFFGLLTAKTWYQSQQSYDMAFQLQNSLFREREWGFKFPSEKARSLALKEVEDEFLKKGGQAIGKTEDGLDLEATLMRRGLPFSINQNTKINEQWVQIAQRISQSEKGLARWEVAASNDELKTEMVDMINMIAKKFTSEENYIG